MAKVTKYSYGCVMLNIAFPLSTMHNYIVSKDVYNSTEGNYGLEDTPHVTLLYGLHEEVALIDVLKVVNTIEFGQLTVGPASLFENEEFDVLKFDVDGPSLHECNTKLKKLPHTCKFPDYHPHLTVGYFKKGQARKYLSTFNKVKLTTYPSFGSYSTPSGDKFKLKLKINFT